MPIFSRRRPSQALERDRKYSDRSAPRERIERGHPIHRFVEPEPDALITPIGKAINSDFLAPEEQLLRNLTALAKLSPEAAECVRRQAERLVTAVRAQKSKPPALQAFLLEYHLGSAEGVILMCLAEALLRIPDAATADRLIADKIPAGAWEEHLGTSESILVNASTFGLLLTGRIVKVDRQSDTSIGSHLGKLVARLGEPCVRAALRQSMRLLGHQFVMGQQIEGALSRSAQRGTPYRYSFDMLGESAITAEDAERYLGKYEAAIDAIGRTVGSDSDWDERPSISVKLSALHPRYELAQRDRALKELAPRLLALVSRARDCGIGFTVDAEESERLEFSLHLIEEVLLSPVSEGYPAFGLAVQAYQRRASSVIHRLSARTGELGRRLTVRLVKGAYWDSEVKRAQERGLMSYPVFTRKENTDVSYLACARLLFAARETLYPQFATHNAHTAAYIGELFAQDPTSFEYQRLHGMGEALYEEILRGHRDYRCRIYAPVGPHKDLLPYLVRRLLENGANTSFVNRLTDEALPVAVTAADPIAQTLSRLESQKPSPHPKIMAPPDLYGHERLNSRGTNLADGAELDLLRRECETAARGAPWEATALINGRPGTGVTARELFNPARPAERIGRIVEATIKDAVLAIDSAAEAFPAWESLVSLERRAAILLRAADVFEQRRAEFLVRLTLEAGKTLPDGLAEVRETVDFLRYYASQARSHGLAGVLLPGPTGETNTLRLRGKGVFFCVSPWNFPLAIFTGQVAAALVAGNTVIAKPAEQTPLAAALAIDILHGAGIPPAVLQFLPGDGATLGERITRNPRIAGVAFTGSTETARLIERNLSSREGAIATFIAETGGINAMIADSSALPEQLVLDVMASAFNSAGQRCSAARILLIQEEIAPRVLELLKGAMNELRLGDPALLSTDIGPIIDRNAFEALERYAERVIVKAPWYHRLKPPPPAQGEGYFCLPLAVEIPSLKHIEREIFGPILHIVRYRAADLDQIIDQLNALGYGLTLGIHTRIEARAERIAAKARVGNIYVNRNMIGAVVGTQPFGGMGLSGTGPKAGGPHYLTRFANEQTVTINTAALGGNTSLLTLTENCDR